MNSFSKRYLFLLFALLITQTTVQAQYEPEPLPIDTAVRYGKLPNGLTYYIRHNNMPKERADFYIAQNVGSVLEEENQRGLAHFLEHMAFNGSKHFPENGIDRYMESIGMRMGENLNAYTGFDETVYMIMNAPVTGEGVVDSCLLILHDWSGYLTLSDEKVEKERGIIREEWRSGQDAQARLWEQQLPKMFPDSRYANRLPIGTIEVIDNFKAEELRDYYHKWYRPDQQAIIIVGDIDPDQVETKVKFLFSTIPMPEHPAERVWFEVPDSDAPLVSIATDKEETNTIIYLFYKHEKLPPHLNATVTGMVKDYIQNVLATMMNERLSELLTQPDHPFVYAEAGDGDYMVAKTMGAWTVAAIAKEGEIDSTLTEMVLETQRVRQFGFTQSEYERARLNLLKAYESHYNERENQRNSTYTREYLSHFTDGGYIPGIETEYALISQIAPNIPIEQVNQYIQDMIDADNIVISITGPDKENVTYPTENEILQTYFKAKNAPVAPYVETVSDEPLIPSLPAPGKITDAKEDPLFGSVVLTLENGVKVILKQTDFKKDQIVMTASSTGGTSLFGNDDAANLKVLNEVINMGGLGNFSDTDLSKRLAGKQVSCTVSVGLDTESLNGWAAPADLDTLFELIYMFFTAPRMDQDAFTSYINRTKAQLSSMELDPMVALSDTLTKAVYNDNPRAKRIQSDDLTKISYPRIMEMYTDRFGDASDFVFTFVGNIDIKEIRPLIEQYLAILPSKGRVEGPNAAQVPSIRKGIYTNHFNRKMEVPKATVVNLYSAHIDYTLENHVKSGMLKQILDLVYTEFIRENEGATYGVYTSVDLDVLPKGEFSLQIYFDTDPNKWKQMNTIIHSELRRIMNNGPREEDFKKTKDNLLKRFAERQQENSYWLNTLDNYYYRDFDGYSRYEEVVTAMTPDDIRTFVREILDQENRIEVVMEP